MSVLPSTLSFSIWNIWIFSEISEVSKINYYFTQILQYAQLKAVIGIFIGFIYVSGGTAAK